VTRPKRQSREGAGDQAREGHGALQLCVSDLMRDGSELALDFTGFQGLQEGAGHGGSPMHYTSE
jgi:hypothetical protein